MNTQPFYHEPGRNVKRLQAALQSVQAVSALYEGDVRRAATSYARDAATKDRNRTRHECRKIKYQIRRMEGEGR